MTKRKKRLLWTDAEDARLRELHAEGRDNKWISNALQRSRGGTYRRLVHLGCIPHPAKRPLGPRLDLPYAQRRRVDNATADERFTAAMRGRLFSIRATNDWAGVRVGRPDRAAFGGGGSSLSFAAGRERSEEAAAK